MVSENQTVEADRKERRRPPRILVVDDDRDARAIYSQYLRAMGCRVLTAHDGADALEKSARQPFDLIVMDLAMPRVDGWAASRQLRRLPRMGRVPIIALSAVAESRESARLAGCNAFLAKPCLPELLWWEVRLLLGRKTRFAAQTRRRDKSTTSSTGKRTPKPPVG